MVGPSVNGFTTFNKLTVNVDPIEVALKLLKVMRVVEVVHGDGEQDPTLPWNKLGRLTTTAELEVNACDNVKVII